MDKNLEQLIKIELARRDLWTYCQLDKPEIFNLKSRPYLKKVCDAIQNHLTNDDDFLLIETFARAGKSVTMTTATPWLYGQNPHERIITVSYNRTLSTDFSKSVRDTIQETRYSPYELIYHDFFPDIYIEKGYGAQQNWSLKGEYSSYFSTSENGMVTGKGATLAIFDDLVSGYETAICDAKLDKIWDWYCNTMLSRTEGKSKQIFIGTPWCKRDPLARIEQYCIDNNVKYKKICISAEDESGNSAYPDVISNRKLKGYKTLMSKEIYSANFLMLPLDFDSEDRLYHKFQTYNILDPGSDKYDELSEPKPDFNKFQTIISYTDTADTGSDYLCNVIAGILNHKAYILDIIHTKASMEITEEQVAQALTKYHVLTARIESNNGGRGFARNIARRLKELNNNITHISTFTQTDPKYSRLLTKSTNVENTIVYPKGWTKKYGSYASEIISFKREKKNEHDDAEDAITGIYETMEKLGYTQ